MNPDKGSEIDTEIECLQAVTTQTIDATNINLKVENHGF